MSAVWALVLHVFTALASGSDADCVGCTTVYTACLQWLIAQRESAGRDGTATTRGIPLASNGSLRCFAATFIFFWRNDAMSLDLQRWSY